MDKDSLREIFRQAFDNFLDNDFEDAVTRATEIYWWGHYPGLMLELLPEGRYRLLHSVRIGNHFVPEGVLLIVPYLGDEEWDDDADIRFYDNAQESMEIEFERALETEAHSWEKTMLTAEYAKGKKKNFEEELESWLKKIRLEE